MYWNGFGTTTNTRKTINNAKASLFDSPSTLHKNKERNPVRITFLLAHQKTQSLFAVGFFDAVSTRQRTLLQGKSVRNLSFSENSAVRKNKNKCKVKKKKSVRIRKKEMVGGPSEEPASGNIGKV